MQAGADPRALASEFLRLHALPPELEAPLAERISQAMEEATRSRLPLSAPPRPRPASARPSSALGPRVDHAASGSRMHADAMAAKQRREAERAIARAEREAASLSELSEPAITAFARSLPRPEPAWQRLASLAGREPTTSERVREERSEALARSLDSCTFSPAVTLRSAQLTEALHAERRRSGMDAHSALYADAQRRALKAERARAAPREDETFAPATLSRSRLPPGPEQAAAAVTRLLAAGQSTSAKLAATAAAARRVDPTSGRTLFVPFTGRGPKGGLRTDGLPVYEHLHLLHEEVKGRLAKRAQAEADAAHAAHVVAGERSAALALARRRRRFASIFRVLAPGGLLILAEAPTLAEARLHAEIAADVRLVCALASRTVLDEPAFVEAMEKVVSSGGGGPRAYLGTSVRLPDHSDLPPPQTSENWRARLDWNGCSFQPSINPASRRLALARRPHGIAIEAAMAADQQGVDERREMRVLEARAREASSAPFAPQLSRRSSSAGGGSRRASVESVGGLRVHTRPSVPSTAGSPRASRASSVR